MGFIERIFQWLDRGIILERHEQHPKRPGHEQIKRIVLG